MKYIIALASTVMLGWLAYAAIASPSQAQQTCQNIATTCGELAHDEMAGCQSDLRDVSAMLGKDIMDQIDDCVTASDSCTDAVACMTTDIGRSTTAGLFQLTHDESAVADNNDINTGADEVSEPLTSELDSDIAQ